MRRFGGVVGKTTTAAMARRWRGDGTAMARRWCGDGSAVEQSRRRARSMKIGKPERVPRAERERTDRLLLG